MHEPRSVAETGSTNDDLAALAGEGANEGLWLRADRQSGGKGRQGRTWQSPPGNLYASTLVRLRSDDPPAATLALVAAVALHEAVSAYAPGIEIKWPNDLLACSPAKAGVRTDGAPGLPPAREHMERAKIAGILLERHADAVVIGFGVNLAFHPDLADRPATSLEALIGHAPGPHAFLGRLAPIFAAWLGRWRAEGLAPIRTAWLAAAHPAGTPIATGDTRGTFDGLDESGALLLRLEGGALRVIHAGDVFLI